MCVYISQGHVLKSTVAVPFNLESKSLKDTSEEFHFLLKLYCFKNTFERIHLLVKLHAVGQQIYENWIPAHKFFTLLIVKLPGHFKKSYLWENFFSEFLIVNIVM